MSETDAPKMDGARIWLVTNGLSETSGWQSSLVEELRQQGAATVDVFGVSALIEQTARDLFGAGLERLAQTFRFMRRGEPDIAAMELAKTASPDLILFDHPETLRVMDRIRAITGTQPLQVGLVTELGEARRWTTSGADALVVGDLFGSRQLAAAGYRPESLLLAGPPVPPSFNREEDLGRCRAELGLEAPFVLIDASSMDRALIEGVAGGLVGVQALDVLIHAGADPAVAELLRAATVRYGVQARMFGEAGDLYRIVRASRGVVTGPESQLNAAVLAAGTPLVSLDLTLGPLAETLGGAMMVVAPLSIGAAIADLANETLHAERVRAVLEVMSNTPNLDVARAVSQLWNQRESLQKPVQTVRTQAQGGGGRFETIGAAVPLAPQPITREVARAQLASLILDERRIEGDIAAWAAERDKWFERLGMAEEEGDTELVEYAGGYTRDLTARIAASNEELRQVQEQKDEVRRRVALNSRRGVPAAPAAGDRDVSGATPDAGAQSPESLEARFRKLERDRQLDLLRKKALGDDD